MKINIVFSCLFAEDLEYMKYYIKNFLIFTDESCVLIINSSNQANFYELNPGFGRVYVHSGSTRRSKVGPTLLLGHLENFAVAREKFGLFGYFCTTASNALFVNRLRGEIAPELMTHRGGDNAFDVDRLPVVWHWPKVEQDPLFLNYLRSIGLTAIRNSQIEGLCAAREDWDHVASHRAFLSNAAQHGLQTFPYEEVFPITILMEQGSGRFGILCHNFWDRFTTSAGAARLDDLIQPLSEFEQPLQSWGSNRVFAMKWFPRDPRNPITALLCQPNAPLHLDALRDMLIRRSDDPIKFFYKEIFRRYLYDLKDFDLFDPINIPSISDQQISKTIYRNEFLYPLRQIIYISDLSGSTHRAYLYLEESDSHYDVELTIRSSSSDYVLYTTCKRLNEACDSKIIAYLYIPCRSLVSRTLLVSARISTDDGNTHRDAERLTYFYNGTYAVMEREGGMAHAEAEAEAPGALFRIELPLDSTHEYGPCYIGIPIVTDVNMLFRIRIQCSLPPPRSREP